MGRFARRIADRAPEFAAAGLLVVLSLAALLAFRYAEQVTWVEHTLRVETELTRLWSALQDAEIGQRGFVVTGDDSFLEPLNEAVASIDGLQDELARLLVDNPAQAAAAAAIRPLVHERMRVATTIVALRRESFDLARQRFLDGRGAELMRDLRERIEAMQRSEQDLLAERRAALGATVRVLLALVGLGAFGVVAVLLAWVVHTRRSARALGETNAELRAMIAARDAAEGQVRQMQKMEAVGQLTGGIAHDFNNMLAVVVSGIGLARRRAARGQDGVDEMLAGALDGANRAASLVKRLLAFSRLQPLAPQVVDANRFVSGMSELIARALGETIRMETILGAELWTTQVDPAQLESAVLNLCVNARDAMPGGGRLTVETANCSTDNDDDGAGRHPGVPAGQYVLIAVTDTGTGMPPEVVERAFDPFFTTKPAGRGTGLGLSQVFGFVRQSGGHVAIDSEAGRGTTVKLYLPRHRGDGEAAEIGPSDAAEMPGTESVLVVEDDPTVLAFASESLRHLGYQVTEAQNAAAALDVLASAAGVDLLLTDIVMPDVNGRQLAERAVMLRPSLKVLFMTGFARPAATHDAKLDVGGSFLAKPFTLAELSRKVREALGPERRR